MALHVYNSMSRCKEPFSPQQPGTVRMYACGITVYDYSHIGHARAMVVFDVMQRYLKQCGYTVEYVRNYTDIDDKIIRRAQEQGVGFEAISERFIAEFDRDMAALGVEPPSVSPRATHHIADMIGMIQQLIARGHAYAVDGDVFFDVSSFDGYGKLSGKDTDSLLAGARVEIDPRKRSPLDFALWKRSKEGEPWWESPWGKGRPGWHIECSVMSCKYLGTSFDIHAGGADLLFPHHENEIAQAECATGKPFARYWLHNGFVNIDQEKMSKSLGNFLTIRDVLAVHHPETIRLFLLSHHYRSPVDYSAQALREARSGLDRLYSLLDRLSIISADQQAPVTLLPSEQAAHALIEKFSAHWTQAMDDDFNTAAALGHLYVLTRSLNKQADRRDKQGPAAVSRALADAALRRYAEAGAVLGIMQENPADYRRRRKAHALREASLNETELDALITQRQQAKQRKDWPAADAIRDRLANQGILLKDTPQGTTWDVAEL